MLVFANVWIDAYIDAHYDSSRQRINNRVRQFEHPLRQRLIPEKALALRLFEPLFSCGSVNFIGAWIKSRCFNS
jgi:hypothetical protein